jgi:tetratricopeptide (TPR) repeat protein
MPEGEAASSRAQLGSVLLALGRFAEAEEQLRGSLAIRVARAPDGWLRWNTQSLLGAALAGLGLYAEAKPLLVEAFASIRPPERYRARRVEAAERVVALNEAWQRPADAERWRAELTRVRSDGR